MTTTADQIPALAVELIPLEQLHESKHNPRTIFPEAELKEMADSLLASGQLTPLLVRPHPNGKGGYEIGAGACRRRSAALAGMTALFAVVRDLDDAEFVALVNTENRQRHNLHPLDEAHGFVDWMKTAGLKIPDIAARIGLSEKYVYDRVKLLQLIPPAQQLFLEGRFEAGHAIILARLSPEDQARAIGDPGDRHKFSDNRIGGLFEPEHVLDAPELDLEEEQPRKAVSVREFQGWVDRAVRFKPEEVDLPNLFPETAAVLGPALEAEERIVKITREYRVPDEAKDEKERTYGSKMWKRADGQSEVAWDGSEVPGAACDRAVLGVVVAGPGRGEAFRVCLARKTCDVHWAKERKEAAKAAKASPGTTEKWWEREQKEAEAERVRWKKAMPALLKAVAEKLATAPAGLDSPLAKLLLVRYTRGDARKGFVPKGKSAEDLVRVMAWAHLREDALSEWRAPTSAPRELKALGLDAAKIVDQVAPREKPAVAPKAAKKKLAGDVRRAKKKKAAR